MKGRHTISPYRLSQLFLFLWSESVHLCISIFMRILLIHSLRRNLS